MLINDMFSHLEVVVLEAGAEAGRGEGWEGRGTEVWE